MKRTSSRRSKENRRRPLRRDPGLPRRVAPALRRGGVGSEETDSVEGPVGEESSPDDPFLGDGAPEAAVVGLPTIVAHHEPIAGRNRDRVVEGARLAADGAGTDEGFLLQL